MIFPTSASGVVFPSFMKPPSSPGVNDVTVPKKGPLIRPAESETGSHLVTDKTHYSLEMSSLWVSERLSSKTFCKHNVLPVFSASFKADISFRAACGALTSRWRDGCT